MIEVLVVSLGSNDVRAVGATFAVDHLRWGNLTTLRDATLYGCKSADDLGLMLLETLVRLLDEFDRIDGGQTILGSLAFKDLIERLGEFYDLLKSRLRSAAQATDDRRS